MSYQPSGQSDYKKSVRAATTANIDLSSPGASIDGVTLSAGDRVLVKNQSTGSQNGIYVFASSTTAMSRANDANTAGELSGGVLIPVEEGSTYADSLWMVSTNGSITLGTTSISFAEVTGGGGGGVAAADVSYAGSSNLVASDVEAALDELDSEKAASSHSHVIGDVTNLQTSLDGKASSSHSHAISDVTSLQTALDGKAASSHSHAISDVTNLQTSLDGKAASSHSHAISDVTGLQTALDGKAASSHSHAISDVTNLQTSLDGKAASSHTHDDRYYTESEVDTLLAAKLDASLIPAGIINPYAGTAAPTGWLLCDGSTISRSTYANLFNAIGTSFGAGDGSTTFALPDLRGRVPVGLDNLDNSVGTGGGDAGRLTVSNTLGGSGGAQTHQLTESEMPSHHHANPTSGTWVVRTGSGSFGFTGTGSNAFSTGATATAITGSDVAHNNMQPYLLLGYIIKT